MCTHTRACVHASHWFSFSGEPRLTHVTAELISQPGESDAIWRPQTAGNCYLGCRDRRKRRCHRSLGLRGTGGSWSLSGSLRQEPEPQTRPRTHQRQKEDKHCDLSLPPTLQSPECASHWLIPARSRLPSEPAGVTPSPRLTQGSLSRKGENGPNHKLARDQHHPCIL